MAEIQKNTLPEDIKKKIVRLSFRKNASLSDIGLAREKFTPAKKKKFISLLYTKYHIGEACAAIGISRNTYECHLEKDPNFRKAVEDAKNYWLDSAENTILELASDPRNGKLAITPAIFALKTHRKEWREKTETEVNVNVEVNFTDDIRRALRSTAIDIDPNDVEEVKELPDANSEKTDS